MSWIDFEHVLEKLDLSPNERGAYEFLLRRRTGKASDVSKALKISPTNVYTTLARLVEKGLLVVSVDRLTHFYPVPLSQFFDQLIIRRQKEMIDRIQELRSVKESSKIELENVEKKRLEREHFQIIKGFNAFAGKFFSSLPKSKKSLYSPSQKHASRQGNLSNFV